jgi:hypothetical protein
VWSLSEWLADALQELQAPVGAAGLAPEPNRTFT